jgi:hypothetical protein
MLVLCKLLITLLIIAGIQADLRIEYILSKAALPTNVTSLRQEKCWFNLKPQNGAHRKPSPAATPSWKLVPQSRRNHEEQTTASSRETWTVPAVVSAWYARIG